MLRQRGRGNQPLAPAAQSARTSLPRRDTSSTLPPKLDAIVGVQHDNGVCRGRIIAHDMTVTPPTFTVCFHEDKETVLEVKLDELAAVPNADFVPSSQARQARRLNPHEQCTATTTHTSKGSTQGFDHTPTCTAKLKLLVTVCRFVGVWQQDTAKDHSERQKQESVPVVGR